MKLHCSLKAHVMHHANNVQSPCCTHTLPLPASMTELCVFMTVLTIVKCCNALSWCDFDKNSLKTTKKKKQRV